MEEKGVQKHGFPFPFFNDEFSRLFSWPYHSEGHSTDLSVYEEDDKVVVEAAMPGLNLKDIEVSYHKGMLTLRGSKEDSEKDKNKKYYKRAIQSFSYSVTVPGNIDENKEPKAEFKDGMIKISFSKAKKEEPRKIPVQQG